MSEIPAAVHGTIVGFANWGCRCYPCRTAADHLFDADRPPAIPHDSAPGNPRVTALLKGKPFSEIVEYCTAVLEAEMAGA